MVNRSMGRKGKYKGEQVFSRLRPRCEKISSFAVTASRSGIGKFRIGTRFFVALLSLQLSGCANPYTEFYTPYTQVGASPTGHIPEASCEGPIEILSADNFAEADLEMFRQGYFPVGESSFNGAAEVITNENILEQARALGACRVVVSMTYSNTVSGVTRLVLPDNKTTHTYSTASAFGTGGSATAFGTSTSTTYGTKVVETPYEVDRYDAGALYFKKMSMPRVGIITQDVSPEISRAMGRNGGILVAALRRGGPAYRADLLEGDVIIAIDGREFNVPDNKGLFGEIIDSNAGKTIEFEIWRDGETLKKPVSIGY